MTNAYSAISFGDGTVGNLGTAQLLSGSGENISLSSGEYFNPNTSQWIASANESAIMAVGAQSSPPVWYWYGTTGLTIGSPVAAHTQIGALSVNGFSIPGFFQTSANPVTAPAFDNSGSTQILVPQGGRVDLTVPFSGMVIITGTNGYWGSAAFLTGSSSVVLLGQSPGYNYVANTTTPAAGQVSLAFTSGVGYSVYNNTGTNNVQFDVMILRTRAAD
jgi:hypothetical protein